MKIRNIQDNDIEESISLIASLLFKRDDKTLNNILLIQFIDNELKLIGCFDKEKIVGILGYSKNYLAFLCIQKEYQKNNIGHLLFKEYLSQLKDQIIYVDANKKNYKFYRNIGFITNDEIIKPNKYQMKYIVGDKNDQKSFIKRNR